MISTFDDEITAKEEDDSGGGDGSWRKMGRSGWEERLRESARESRGVETEREEIEKGHDEMEELR